MKYLFLNHFAFENIDSSKQDEDVVNVFNAIAYLLKELQALDYELIFDNKLSSFTFNNQSIHHYIKSIEDKEARTILFIKIQKQEPFCSNNFDGYFGDENIVLGDCFIKDTEIDILENFLACALFLDSSVITPKAICQENCFLSPMIEIQCNTSIRTLNNLFLEDNQFILENIQNMIKENIDNWDSWIDNVLPSYTNIDISSNCFKEIKVYSFSSDIIKSILRFIKSINIFVNNKIVTNINYEECCSNTKLESDTRLKKLNNKLMVHNCNNVKEIANWHTWIKKDFRLYFTLDEANNKICFVKFTKKIT